MKTKFLPLWVFAIILFAAPISNTALWGQAAPTTAEEFRARGWTFVENRDFARAIADFDQAIRLDPNFARAYRNRGFAHFNKGDYDRAIADYEAALRIDPNHTLARGNIENARRELSRLASSVPFPSTPTTLEATIRLFPANLQNGFREEIGRAHV